MLCPELPQSPISRMSRCHVSRPLNTWLTVSDNECAGRTKTTNVLLVTVACFRRLLCIEFERYSVSRCRLTERESSSIELRPSRLLAGRVSRRRCRPRARKKKNAERRSGDKITQRPNGRGGRTHKTRAREGGRRKNGKRLFVARVLEMRCDVGRSADGQRQKKR